MDGEKRDWPEHREIVQAISKDVAQYHARGQRFRIAHGSTNSTRNPSAKGTNFIDTSKLCNVLAVDTETQTATVEPNVPMDQLVEATLPYGLIPPVVMEFPGITAGGGYAGTSGESSSFRHGFFDQTVKRAEIVLGDGEIVEATRDEHSDLLHGAAGAVGTLGITTLLEIQLIPAKKYVRAAYHPVSSVPRAVEITQKVIADPENDYVDGILYSRTNGAIIVGRLTDGEPSAEAPLQTFSAARDPWFYVHVRNRIANASSVIYETIPLAEYLFRYDRGGFWVGESAFNYFYMPFNRYTRWFLDDFMHTRMLYKALHASGHSARFFVQDLAVPFDKTAEFVDFVHERLNIYPLWLCPLRQSPTPTMHPHDVSHQPSNKPMLNVGVWGYGPRYRKEFVQVNRDLEAKLAELGGMKWLYAHAYYSETDFWSQFDKEWYEELRKKYHATQLPNVYDKVHVQVDPDASLSLSERILDTWPCAGLYGLAHAIASGTYHNARAATWTYSSTSR